MVLVSRHGGILASLDREIDGFQFRTPGGMLCVLSINPSRVRTLNAACN